MAVAPALSRTPPAQHYLRRQEKSPETRERSDGLRFSRAFHCHGQSWGTAQSPAHGTLPHSTVSCPHGAWGRHSTLPQQHPGCQGLLPHSTQGQHTPCPTALVCPHGTHGRQCALTWSCSYSRMAAYRALCSCSSGVSATLLENLLWVQWPWVTAPASVAPRVPTVTSPSPVGSLLQPQPPLLHLPLQLGHSRVKALQPPHCHSTRPAPLTHHPGTTAALAPPRQPGARISPSPTSIPPSAGSRTGLDTQKPVWGGCSPGTGHRGCCSMQGCRHGAQRRLCHSPVWPWGPPELAPREGYRLLPGLGDQQVLHHLPLQGQRL